MITQESNSKILCSHSYRCQDCFPDRELWCISCHCLLSLRPWSHEVALLYPALQVSALWLGGSAMAGHLMVLGWTLVVVCKSLGGRSDTFRLYSWLFGLAEGDRAGPGGVGPGWEVVGLTITHARDQSSASSHSGRDYAQEKGQSLLAICVCK